MTAETAGGMTVDYAVLGVYFETLVNYLFKILPMKEGGETTLTTYIGSLQKELLGCYGLFPSVAEDGSLLSIITILQYMLDHSDCPVGEVRREVFHAISICNRLKERFSEV